MKLCGKMEIVCLNMEIRNITACFKLWVPDAAMHVGLCFHTEEYMAMSKDFLLYFSIFAVLRANEKLSTKGWKQFLFFIVSLF